MTYVVYNGAGGGLGRHLGRALGKARLANAALRSRLGDVATLRDELDGLPGDPPTRLVLVQCAARVRIEDVAADPAGAFEVNVTGTTATAAAFVEWALDHGHQPAVVFVGSGHVYAPPPTGERVAEDGPLRPLSIYAKTKLAGEERLRVLADDHGADLVVARVFGMIGPDQRPGYLLPGLVRRVRDGDLDDVPGLDHVRDYLDVRDVARHLASLAAAIDPGIQTVNVCSGEPTRVRDLLDQVMRHAYASDPGQLDAVRSTVRAAAGRDSDVVWLVGDPTLLAKVVGEPIRSIAIADTVREAMA